MAGLETPSPSRSRALLALASLACFALLACTSGSRGVGATRQANIYDADDRRDWWELGGGGPAELGRRSVGVLVSRGKLGGSTDRLEAFADDGVRGASFCEGEPFRCQRRLGGCTATLIDGHTMVSAGHCTHVTTGEEEPTEAERRELAERLQAWCDRSMVVMNWREVERERTPPGALPPGETGGRLAEIVPERDVYYCHEVLAHSFVPLGGSGGLVKDASSDLLVFTVRREAAATRAQPVVEPYGAAPVASEPAVRPTVGVGETMTGIGFPEGLPMKFKSASVSRPSDAYGVELRMDVLGGDSGGGLFNARGEIIAALSGSLPNCPPGARPRRAGSWGCFDEARGCNVENRYSGGSTTLTARYTFIHRAVRAMCGAPGDGGPPVIAFGAPRASHLCGTAPPVASAPYVPSPPPEPPAAEEPLEEPPGAAESVGCAAGGPAGAAGTGLMLLALAVARRRRRALGLALVFAIGSSLTAGCASPTAEEEEDDDDAPFWLRDAGPEDASASDAGVVGAEEDELTHVVSYVRLPRERDALGLDLDGDGSPDSALGAAVELFDDVGVSLSRPLTAAVLDGRLRLLSRARLGGGASEVELVPGLVQPLGVGLGGAYEADPTRPSTRFVGEADGAAFTAAAERHVLELPLFDGVAPIQLPLEGARLEGSAGAVAFEAVLGGAVPVDALRGGLFVPLAAAFDVMLADDPGCPSACESVALGLASALIDADGDGRLTADELQGFGPLAAALAPDLDLDGDGEADALSVGVELEGTLAEIADAREATAHKAAVCFDRCTEARSCAECNSVEFAGCGWCDGSGCMPDAQRSLCEEEWRGNAGSCLDCSAYTDCEACVLDPFCGWCPGSGCLAGRSSSALECAGFQDLRCDG